MLKDSIKEIKKQDKNFVNESVEYDIDGYAKLPIVVSDDDCFLSPYSVRGNEVISNEVADFLENNLSSYPIGSKLSIEIKGDTVDKVEEERYKKGIKNFYFNKIVDVNRKLKENLKISLLMLIIGVIVLSAYLVLEYIGQYHILASVIDIMAWVFIWESIDLYFIRRKGLKLDKLRFYSLYDSKITFKK